MFQVNCPSCGAPVQFKSKASVFAVCTYCKSTLVRQDMNVELFGKMAELQEDLSPLQLGTRGRFNKKAFEIIGRLRIKWSQGFWNEWYALFDDERTGWLAEAQGFFAMSFPVVPLPQLPSVSEIKLSQEYPLEGSMLYQVDDIKTVTCLGSEGELPMAAYQGREGVSIDLTGPNDRFATLEYSPQETRLYIGQYEEFDAFQFSNLRTLYGWS